MGSWVPCLLKDTGIKQKITKYVWICTCAQPTRGSSGGPPEAHRAAPSNEGFGRACVTGVRGERGSQRECALTRNGGWGQGNHHLRQRPGRRRAAECGTGRGMGGCSKERGAEWTSEEGHLPRGLEQPTRPHGQHHGLGSFIMNVSHDASATCDHVGGPGGRCATGKKSGAERRTPCELAYYMRKGREGGGREGKGKTREKRRKLLGY